MRKTLALSVSGLLVLAGQTDANARPDWVYKHVYCVGVVNADKYGRGDKVAVFSPVFKSTNDEVEIQNAFEVRVKAKFPSYEIRGCYITGIDTEENAARLLQGSKDRQGDNTKISTIDFSY